MKRIKSIACAAILGMTFTSCNDFLTLLPLNEVVLENYWTDKSDVESVLLGTYAALETQDCIFRMSMWGEMRSDNIKASTNNPPEDILNITKDNILETNSYAGWACFYDVINRANTVLEFAPQVAKKDPNYTPAELRANEAEAVALRSLCYWYLIRAYKDVPFVTRASKDDTENFVIPVTSFDEILNHLINDLEEVKDFAVNRYVRLPGFTSEEVTASRITRAAIYTLLADMYLWRGDYDLCVERANFVIGRKLKDYDRIYDDPDEGGDYCVIKLYNGIPLLSEIGSYDSPTDAPSGGSAYSEIFGYGYSFESIFELSFEPNQVSNSFIGSNYMKSQQSGEAQIGNLIPASDITITPDASGSNKLFSVFDGRYYENICVTRSSSYGITKYSLDGVTFTMSTGGSASYSYSTRGTDDEPNWIIYRFTDLLLMKAEAEVMLASSFEGTSNADSTSICDSLLREAFNVVSAVNKRACIYAPDNQQLKYNNYNTVEKMDKLVLDERQRELMFEGKRWFDLVRRARRAGSTSELAAVVATKHTGSNSTFATKIKKMDYIYFPIEKNELKINPLLKQNPAFVLDEFIEKN